MSENSNFNYHLIPLNKYYDIKSIEEITDVTVYYINNYNDEFYYVPVTKYMNDKRDKIEIIIDQLKGYSMYDTDLMTFMN